MIRLEDMTPPQNVQPVPVLLHNRWVINNDFVFHLVTERRSGVNYRRKIAIPAKATVFKQIKPRRMRAEIVRSALRHFKRGGSPISWSEAERGFIQTLKADGCHPLFCAYQRAKLVLFGVLTRGWRYWHVPQPAESTAKFPQSAKEGY